MAGADAHLTPDEYVNTDEKLSRDKDRHTDSWLGMGPIAVYLAIGTIAVLAAVFLAVMWK